MRLIVKKDMPTAGVGRKHGLLLEMSKDFHSVVYVFGPQKPVLMLGKAIGMVINTSTRYGRKCWPPNVSCYGFEKGGDHRRRFRGD
ncbi:hypothetical protein J2Y45_003430 [Dyadobacter sp. BE34]|uniref:Uncharacterized protein n=1 Tax=Dyadobacter fermentans TaxID=94254 RepID=A0ABU1QYK3_9BACT|nr:hypothetical protein [Dyadobacter fermentans]MDR7043979.1 hypothetical protein [Dyadobacter sp. BE242]MDR7198290.1 hypothetical protein [Dyadobacter sp. BE34]MDR7216253.1 hypothetical protein [Dyadobacter sp. BE31]MDR7264221.1 hypothetical protein [Dyadobacter sp. BE32]